MTVTAAVLLLISAFGHAGWNIIGEKWNPSVSAFFLASITGLLIIIVPAILY